MDPLKVLAVLDAAITVVDRANDIVEEAKAKGLITVEEQREVHSKYEELKLRLGK